jgi:hypothetical protein
LAKAGVQLAAVGKSFERGEDRGGGLRVDREAAVIIHVAGALASALHPGGPGATAGAGRLIGNRSRRYAMSETSRTQLATDRELVDEIPKAVRFGPSSREV